MSRGFGLYVHLPFCTHRCSYCDFFSSTQFTESKFEQIIEALETELRFRAEFFAKQGWALAPADTVFIGGGTPSLFSVELIHRLMETLADCFALSPSVEITMEANPETLSREYLKALREQTAINRISMGAQSFSARHLTTLERRCSPDDVRKAVGLVATAGYDNYNLDLIFAIPGQTLQESLDDIQSAAALGTTHISRYQLTLSPGHKLYSQLPDEEFQADAYEQGVGLLESLGYGLYEISNFSKPGRQCRHNLLYWTGGDFLGVGPSASSRFFRNGVFHHFKQVSDLARYLEGADHGWTAEWQRTTAEQTFLEAAFLELRTDKGVSIGLFQEPLRL